MGCGNAGYTTVYIGSYRMHAGRIKVVAAHQETRHFTLRDVMNLLPSRSIHRTRQRHRRAPELPGRISSRADLAFPFLWR